jgi:hypothetical protein
MPLSTYHNPVDDYQGDYSCKSTICVDGEVLIVRDSFVLIMGDIYCAIMVTAYYTPRTRVCWRWWRRRIYCLEGWPRLEGEVGGWTAERIHRFLGWPKELVVVIKYALMVPTYPQLGKGNVAGIHVGPFHSIRHWINDSASFFSATK